MKTTLEIFRKRNFIILDALLNNGEYSIQGKMFTNLSDNKFQQPVKVNQPKKAKINEIRS